MLYSMTGYGRSEVALNNITIQLEVKSVNGKSLDISVRLPLQLKSLEIPMRKAAQDELKRGSVEVLVTYQENDENKPLKLNTALLEKFLKQLTEFSDKHQLDKSDILPALMGLPDVVASTIESWSEEDSEKIMNELHTAVEKVTNYRKTEGEKLEPALRKNIATIQNLSQEVDQYESERKESIKSRMRKNADEVASNVDIDNDRLEQEIFFYIEKIDISEEKQRLQSHLDYFLEILDKETDVKGKQLNFISQEIGRELNTLGAKSYNSQMQALVIQMKDELEQIKEQILNVL